MRELENAMAVAAQRAGDETQKTRIGVVDSYDPTTFSVKVRLQPSNVLSGWIPIASSYVGNGWGLMAAPTIGDMVCVDAQEGDINAGIMTGSLFNDVDRPLAVPSGEFWLQHRSGSFIKFLNDGNVEIHAAGDLTAVAGGSAHVTAATEITLAAPAINLNAPDGIALNGPMTQGLGSNSGSAHMRGPLLVDNEVTAVTTPLHTHQHLNGGGVGNSGNPTP